MLTTGLFIGQSVVTMDEKSGWRQFQHNAMPLDDVTPEVLVHYQSSGLYTNRSLIREESEGGRKDSWEELWRAAQSGGGE